MEKGSSDVRLVSTNCLEPVRCFQFEYDPVVQEAFFLNAERANQDTDATATHVRTARTGLNDFVSIEGLAGTKSADRARWSWHRQYHRNKDELGRCAKGAAARSFPSPGRKSKPDAQGTNYGGPHTSGLRARNTTGLVQERHSLQTRSATPNGQF